MPDAVQPVAPSRAHETADVDGPRIGLVAGVLATTLLVVACAAWGALHLLRHETDRALYPTTATPTHMPSPPLQSAPAVDLRALREQKRAMLSEYRWIDRDLGIVRIPIEQAMEVLIARNPVKTQ